MPMLEEVATTRRCRRNWRKCEEKRRAKVMLGGGADKLEQRARPAN